LERRWKLERGNKNLSERKEELQDEHQLLFIATGIELVCGGRKKTVHKYLHCSCKYLHCSLQGLTWEQALCQSVSLTIVAAGTAAAGENKARMKETP
jgi:hypothetical protein